MDCPEIPYGIREFFRLFELRDLPHVIYDWDFDTESLELELEACFLQFKGYTVTRKLKPRELALSKWLSHE